MGKIKTEKKANAKRYNVVFKFITILIPFVFLFLFEGVLRIANYGDNLDLFIKNPVEGYEKYMIVNPEVGKKYFQKFEYTAPANDIFLAEKPENTMRIFVMGSSTVFGFPYERNLMFSRILHKQLEDAYPGKKIEMINTAITAINSFTLRDFAGQILEQKPDAILIYAGHNEFYGAFGVGSNETMSKNSSLTRVHIFMMDFKIYQLLRNLISSFSKMVSSRSQEMHGTLMKRMVGNKDILYGSDAYKIGIENFRQNMDAILKMATQKGVPVFISEVVSNVSGMEPFNSVAANGQEAAIDIFRKAKTVELAGKFEEASELYFKAKDLDCIRFRASEDINVTINKLAEKHKSYKIPMVSIFKAHSPNGLIGYNLMTEHLHPNIEGNFLIADSFYKEIVKSGIMGTKAEMPEYSIQYRKRNYGYTALDSIAALQRVQTLKGNWPFVKSGEKEINFLTQYHPKTYIDSIAFAALKDDKLTLSEVRLDLARKYEKAGRVFMAFKEYEALVQTTPYVAVNYRDVANCLIQLSDLPLALKYFQKSLELEESGFAYFKIGEIYFFMGDYDNALLNFEKSFPLIPDDKKVIVLVKSYIACMYGNNAEKAKAIAKELKRVKAEKYLSAPPKSYTFSQYIPFQTREQVESAKELIAANKLSEALKILINSLEIYDSHIANRLIGEIYQRQQNYSQALIYFKKTFDLFKFDPQFLHNLALVYLGENDVANARKCLEDIKKLDPEYLYLSQLSSLISATN